MGDDIFFDILVNRYKDVEFTVLLQSASAKNFLSADAILARITVPKSITASGHRTGN